MKHTLLIIAATLAVVALGGYVAIPGLSDATKFIANKTS